MRAFAKPLGIAVLGLAALAASAFLTVSRPLHFDSAWTDRTRRAFERATGLPIAIRGPIDVSVFPRPMLVAHDVEIGGPRDPLSVQAPVVRGLFSVMGLLAGRTVFDKLEVDGMSGSVDADALVGDHGGPPHPQAGKPPDAGLELPATLAVVAGSLQVRSAHPGLSGFVGDLHLLVDGLAGGAGSIAGGATWHGEQAEVTGRVDSVAQFVGGKPTAGSLKIRSSTASASAVGTFTAGYPGAFKGSLAASASSLSTLLRMVGLPPGVLAGIGHFSFSGTAAPTQDGIAFEDAHLVVNEDSLEGSIALQMQDGRLDLLGTLAAEKLDISPFLATLPRTRTADGAWSTEPIPFEAADLHDTDLRLSVGRLQHGDLHADDVALSVLARHGRMELSLGEARTYGGLLKARLFTAASPGQIKADLSWSQIDMAALSKALPGTFGKASGSSSGYVALDGSGDTAKAIVDSLNGKGQASWRQMQVQSLPALAALLQPGAANLPVPLGFDLASLDFTVTGGLLSIGRATLARPDLRLDIGGQIFLPSGAFILSASPRGGNEAAASAAAPTLTRRVAGVWGKSVRRIDTEAPDQPASGPTGPAGGLSP